MATVHWYKNTNMALTNDSATFKNHKHRHTLVFSEVREEDFGNYTCRARNKLGETWRTLEISRKEIITIFKLIE